MLRFCLIGLFLHLVCISQAFAQANDVIEEKVVHQLYEAYRQGPYQEFKKGLDLSSPLHQVGSASGFVDWFDSSHLPEGSYSQEQIQRTKFRMIHDGYGVGGIAKTRRASGSEIYLLLKNLKYASPYITPLPTSQDTPHAKRVDRIVQMFKEAGVQPQATTPQVLRMSVRTVDTSSQPRYIPPVEQLWTTPTIKQVIAYTDGFDGAGAGALKTTMSVYAYIYSKGILESSRADDITGILLQYVVDEVLRCSQDTKLGSDAFASQSHKGREVLESFIKSQDISVESLRRQIASRVGYVEMRKAKVEPPKHRAPSHRSSPVTTLHRQSESHEDIPVQSQPDSLVGDQGGEVKKQAPGSGTVSPGQSESHESVPDQSQPNSSAGEDIKKDDTTRSPVSLGQVPVSEEAHTGTPKIGRSSINADDLVAQLGRLRKVQPPAEKCADSSKSEKRDVDEAVKEKSFEGMPLSRGQYPGTPLGGGLDMGALAGGRKVLKPVVVSQKSQEISEPTELEKLMAKRGKGRQDLKRPPK